MDGSYRRLPLCSLIRLQRRLAGSSAGNRVEDWYAPGRRMLAVLTSLVAVAFIIGPGVVQAATYYWDTAGGTWGNGANWSDNAVSGGTTGTVPGAADSGVFNQSSVNGAEIISLETNYSVLGIVFTNTGTTRIQSDSSTTRILTNGTGGITVNRGAGAVSIGSTNNPLSISLGGAQTWNVNSTNGLTIKGNISGTTTSYLYIRGTGTTTLANGSASSWYAYEGNGLVDGGATLTLSNYSVSYGINNNNRTIGIGMSSANNTINVGAGSTLTSPGGSGGEFALGGAGNNRIYVHNGGTFAPGYRWNLGNMVNNVAQAEGDGSTITFNGNQVNGTGGSVKATNGGTIYWVCANGKVGSTLNLSVYGTDPITGAPAVMDVGTQLYLNNAVGNTASVTSGGLLQFTSAAPTMGFYSDGSVVTINGGGLSYRNATGVDMSANKTPTANTVGAFTWLNNLGPNTLRLNGSTDTGSTAYTFASNLGANNYAALQLYGTCSISRAITFDGDNGGSMLVNGATATLSGGIVLNPGSSTAAVTVTAKGGASQLTGVISGSGGFTLGSPSTNTLTLKSTNTYTGVTTVNAGTLALSASSTNNIAASSAISIGGGATLNVAGLSSGTIVLTQPLRAYGTGTANVTGSVNAGAGTIDLQDGTNPGMLAISGGLTLAGGGTLRFDLGTTAGVNDRVSIAGAANLSGTTTIDVAAVSGILGIGTPAYTLITAGSGVDYTRFTLSTPTMIVNGQSYDLALTGDATNLFLNVSGTISGPSTAFWGGTSDADWNTAANWYTDATNNVPAGASPGSATAVSFYTATPTAGILSTTLGADVRINTLTYLPSATAATTIGGAHTLFIGGGITVNTPESGTVTHTISADVSLAASPLQPWVVNTNATLAVNGNISGANGLSVSGGGTLILSGTETYTGATRLNAGTLVLSGSGTINASSGIIVNGTGAVFMQNSSAACDRTFTLTQGTLGGTGEISTPLSCGANATVAPGDRTLVTPARGSLTIANSVNLGGTINLRLFSTAADDSDQLIQGTTGSLTYGGTLKVANLAGTLASGNNWKLFSFVSQGGKFSNDSVFGTAGDGANLPTLTGGLVWKFDYNTGILAVAPGVATYYWDTTNTVVWANGTNWSLNSSGTPSGVIAPGAADSAVFNGSSVNGPETVQLNAACAIAGIAFNNTGTTRIQSDSTTSRKLTIGTGGITVNSGAGAVTIGSTGNPSPITISGNQNWTTASGRTLTVVGNVVGAASYYLYIRGTGTTTLTNGTANFVVLSGQPLVDGGTTLTLSNYTLTLGCSNGNGSYSIGGGSANNTLNVGAGSVCTPGGAEFTIGTGGFGNNRLYVSNGGTFTTGYRWAIGNLVSNVAWVDGDGSTMTLGGNQVNGTGGSIKATNGGLANWGCVNGKVLSTLNLYVSGTDPVTGAAAVMDVGTQLYLNAGAGNTATVTNGGFLQFTSATPSMGLYSNTTVTVNGGGLSYRNATGVDMSASKTPTANTVGAFTWAGTNTFRLNGSTETGAGDYTFASNLGAANYAQLQLYGTNSISRKVVFDGGNGGSLLVNGSTNNLGGGMRLNGLVPFIARGAASSLTGLIGGSGSLAKDGPGTLILTSTNNYTGDTSVRAGTLRITHPFLCEYRDVYVTTNANFYLDFVGTNTIRSLYLDDQKYISGLFGRDAAGGPTWFSGTGFLKVECGTVVTVR